MSSPTFSDRLLTSIKNNRYLATLIVAATIIIGLAQFSGALQQLRTLIWPDLTRARATYRTLFLNLNSAETAIANFNGIPLEPTTIQGQARHVLIEGDAVCDSKTSLAEIGDATTRQEIDSICSGFEAFRNLADPEFRPSANSESKFKARVVVIRAVSTTLAEEIRKLRQSLIDRGLD